MPVHPLPGAFTGVRNWTKSRLDLKRFARHSEGMIGITGCGRSGTTFTSELLRSYGYEVGHEMLGRHGISSWCLAPYTSERCWGPSPVDLRSLKLPLVHQVRHPLDAIASFTTAGTKSWQFISMFIPVNPEDDSTLRCMKYWHYWNELAEERSLATYRVESIDGALPEMFKIAGFNAARLEKAPIRSTSEDTNRRNHKSVTWAALHDADPALASQIGLQAARYGYATE